MPKVDSTNNYVKNELAKSKPLPEGTVILAEEQYAGRGQEAGTWISEPGKNLTFSIVLYPGFLSPTKQFMLNIGISLAVYDALEQLTGPHLKIKWPNDMYVNDDKLGGILIENNIRGSRWNSAIVGIGINVNQLNFPESIQNVTSLCKILHTEYNLKRLLTELCRTVEMRYLQLKAEKHDELRQEYVQRLYRLNQQCRYRINGKTVAGVITGIHENGKLQVLSDEKLYSFGLKEIAYIIS